MHTSTSLSAVAAAVLAALPATQASIYLKNSPVLQVTSKNYDQLITQSNHTSIIEFFAPWCGHCQNLKPAYEKAARNLAGLANVAAMDCDDDANKPFCGRMGVQGFPTLKIVRPGKKTGRPVIQDYQGPRTATGIVDAVLASINNHVQKVTDIDIDAFLESSDQPKVLLFTDKGTTTPLLKSIAIDFLGVLSVGQVRSKETQAVKRFGVSAFPTLVLLPNGTPESAVVYDGPLKKDAIVGFLSQAGSPNPHPDSTPQSAKEKRTVQEKKHTKPQKAKPSSSSSADADAEEQEATTTSTPTEQQTAPVLVESALPLPTIHTAEKLKKECLYAKGHTCMLVFVASDADKASASQAALDNLAELAHKYVQSKRHLFPIYAVPVDTNAAAADVLKALDLAPPQAGGEPVAQLVAINARRGWWRHYESVAADAMVAFSHEALENWIDTIRMGEGVKKKLPKGIVVISDEDTRPAETSGEPTNEPEKDPEQELAGEPSAAVTESAGIKHEEL